MNITGSGTSVGIIIDHNLFGAGLKTDIPSVTSARVNMFSNLITATNNTSATVAGAGAQILSQNNIYQGTNNPLTKNGGLLRAVGNNLLSTTGTPPAGDDTVFTPSYSYAMTPAGADAASAAALIALINNTTGNGATTPPPVELTAGITFSGNGSIGGSGINTATVPAGGSFTLTANPNSFTQTSVQ